MEKISEQQGRSESKTQLVEQINACLRSGDYSRALDMLRGSAVEFPNDAELSQLEKLANDGVKRSAEANRLITESQELFAQRKSAEAIQLLRKAHELDKNNSLARAILANALVEHAQSVVETDWLQGEMLTNQALALNPAHPTAKTILSLIVAKKETSSVEDWVSQARKLQSAGDLFAALAWVAEGLAVHPHDPKLLLIQDAIQRDQDARRRQARRGDLDDLRRLQREIDGTTDVAAKQALAARIQSVAAKHWTDGEILSIANALLLRLGLVSQESSSTSPRGKGATVILHVPRPSAPETPSDPSRQIPDKIPAEQILADRATPSPVPPTLATATPLANQNVPGAAASTAAVPTIATPSAPVPTREVKPRDVRMRKGSSSVAPPAIAVTPPKQTDPSPGAIVPAREPSNAPAKVTASPARPKQPASSNSTTLILVSAAAIVLVVTTFVFTKRHYAGMAAKSQSAPETASGAAGSSPAPSTATSVPPQTTPTGAAPAPTSSEPSPSLPGPPASPDTGAGKAAVDGQALPVRPKDVPSNNIQPNNIQPSNVQASNVQPNNVQAPVESGDNLGTLVVVAGQNDAKVFLNGKLQRQLTQAGQLRLSNLELKDYVVQVSKNGFQDPPQQTIRIRKGLPAKVVFNLQPQPRLASLTIQGGAPGATVLVDQIPVGTIQPDGTLTVSSVNPGDHTVELRKERFKPRQFKEHFAAGETMFLAVADAALEAAPSELKITFTPADASVALVKGELLKIVSSGVPLSLPPGTYTLTARTAERFTRTATLEVVAGQSKTLNLSLGPNGMSKWEDPGGWKQEKDVFIRKGGDFVLYGVTPASGTFTFSAMPAKGRLLQWVLNYSDPNNYVLFQMDDDYFYRTVIRNGQKTAEVKIPDKVDKKSFRTLQIRVSPTELVHQVEHGDHWTVVDRWTQPGANLSQGKFGFYIPANDQVSLSKFAHYADLNIR